MALFRPSNVNKRLVSPTGGNGGVIGATKTPYCNFGAGAQITLGCRCFGGGACGGIFKTTESYCGRKESCNIAVVDCGGFFICGASSVRWFVAPSTTQVARTWYLRDDAVTLANSCIGSCGWFVPTCGQLQNPGYPCRTYWDSFCNERYWSSTECNSALAFRTHFGFGGQTAYSSKENGFFVRAFRCVSY